MGRLSWYFNRLRAMSIPEVFWRLQQKNIQKRESILFRNKNLSVCSFSFYRDTDGLKFNPEALGINFSNYTFGTCTSIHLLGCYNYLNYKKEWNAGFQTPNKWGNEWSYGLNYKQRDDIGDARTNWELNRHFQFALLGKAYYATGKKEFCNELNELFYDWNKSCPFLHGISWTSVMEVAIRCIQWCVTLAFLRKRGCVRDGTMLSEMETGIKNMAGYVARHYSRYSSANNHLLVEATSLAYAGFAFGCEMWWKLAVRLLNEQLSLQNFNDGVNKEMSLHYQTFGMEGYALTMHLMKCNGVEVPKAWIDMIARQCEFVAHSIVGDAACEFGDNDEGKILDLQGGDISHYKYVLQLCSLVAGRRFEDFNEVSETINWLFPDNVIDECRTKPKYDASASRTFHHGGYSFLRSESGRVMVGIDHAPLGFGAIAAHGHADALSFQMFVDGKPLFIDPGTYIYHCWLDERNEFRKSINHNTVVINGCEQSQMLGAFLWGKRASTKLISSRLGADSDMIEAYVEGLSVVRHTRRFTLERKGFGLTIEDMFSKDCQWLEVFVLAPEVKVVISGNVAHLPQSSLTTENGEMELVDTWASSDYGVKYRVKAIHIKGNGNKNKTIWTGKY